MPDGHGQGLLEFLLYFDNVNIKFLWCKLFFPCVMEIISFKWKCKIIKKDTENHLREALSRNVWQGQREVGLVPLCTSHWHKHFSPSCLTMFYLVFAFPNHVNGMIGCEAWGKWLKDCSSSLCSRPMIWKDWEGWRTFLKASSMKPLPYCMWKNCSSLWNHSKGSRLA